MAVGTENQNDVKHVDIVTKDKTPDVVVSNN